MRKVSKALATLLAVCLLFTGAMTIFADSTSPVPSSSYQRPDMAISKITSAITLDGELEAAWKNEATKIEFTKSALQSSGILWKYTDDDGETWGPDTTDGEGTAYVGWNEGFFLFALEVKDSENTNDQVVNSDLWRGDCLQMQIGASTNGFIGEDSMMSGVERYEFGFALSSLTKRGLGYEWMPASKDLPAAKKQAVSDISGDMGYFVKSANGTTTYEVALRPSAFGHDGNLSKGEEIPFSFSLHIYKNPSDALGENDTGWFLEWARGVVGGDTANDTADDPYFGVKNIGSAARLTLSDGDPIPPKPSNDKTTTTKQNPTNTTKGDDKPTSNNPSNSTQPSGDQPTQPDGEPAQTTAAPTTTTTAPEVAGVDKYYKDEEATDVDDANIINAIKSQLEADKVTIPAENTMVVKSYVPGAPKFAIPLNDVAAIYVKDGDAYKKLTGEDFKDADGNDTGWYVFDVSSLEENAAVYVVKSVAPTTTVATTTKTATTTGKQADVTTTKASTDETKIGSSWWIWLIVILAVLVVAGVIVFFVLKKKNENDDTDGTDGDDDASSNE